MHILSKAQLPRQKESYTEIQGISDAYQMLAGWTPFLQFHIKEIVIVILILRIAIYVFFLMLGFKLPFTAYTSCLSHWWCAHARLITLYKNVDFTYWNYLPTCFQNYY